MQHKQWRTIQNRGEKCNKCPKSIRDNKNRSRSMDKTRQLRASSLQLVKQRDITLISRSAFVSTLSVAIFFNHNLMKNVQRYIFLTLNTKMAKSVIPQSRVQRSFILTVIMFDLCYFLLMNPLESINFLLVTSWLFLLY